MGEPGEIDARPILEACRAYMREALADSLIPDPDSVKRAMNNALDVVDNELREAGLIDEETTDG